MRRDCRRPSSSTWSATALVAFSARWIWHGPSAGCSWSSTGTCIGSGACSSTTSAGRTGWFWRTGRCCGSPPRMCWAVRRTSSPSFALLWASPDARSTPSHTKSWPSAADHHDFLCLGGGGSELLVEPVHRGGGDHVHVFLEGVVAGD